MLDSVKYIPVGGFLLLSWVPTASEFLYLMLSLALLLLQDHMIGDKLTKEAANHGSHKHASEMDGLIPRWLH